MESPKNHESKELLPYELNIVIHRHGPKIGSEGPLSEEGKEAVGEYFDSAYDGVIEDVAHTAHVEHSPIHRARETAEIYSRSIAQSGMHAPESIVEDERLSEGGIAENKAMLEKLLKTYGGGGNFINGWLQMKERPSPEVKTGTEAVQDFSSWLLDKIEDAQKSGGAKEITAFSHGPVMLAFLVKLQEKSRVDILPEDWRSQDVFGGLLGYLSNLHIWTDSKDPENIHLSFNRKQHSIPIQTVKQLTRYHIIL